MEDIDAHPPAPGHPALDPGRTAAASRPAPPRVARRLDSQVLFGGAVEVLITHGDACYRLRRTALGKLILTK